ncbi:lasso RiPP family leader peptide-containing protein [Streptomyces sp. NPDC058420]|nr:precursor A [Streptomyces sp.]UXX91730.1 lasso RiPP family leader peptide-containing protein [Streptomyces sp. AD2-2]
METNDVYEPPALEEIGGFAELTMAFGPCVENDWFAGTAWIC